MHPAARKILNVLAEYLQTILPQTPVKAPLDSAVYELPPRRLVVYPQGTDRAEVPGFEGLRAVPFLIEYTVPADDNDREQQAGEWAQVIAAVASDDIPDPLPAALAEVSQDVCLLGVRGRDINVAFNAQTRQLSYSIAGEAVATLTPTE